ncbi:MAG: FecR domain-containing protein [candidate division KSB1 bacterium]|nr:FecR domain-containing protein [candidate division KSB1 bacterium]
MKNHIPWTLVAKYLSDECTASEKNWIESCMLQNSDFCDQMHQYQKLWDSRYHLSKTRSTEALWRELREKMQVETDHRTHAWHASIIKTGKILRVAAVAVVIFIVSYIYTHGFTGYPGTENPISYQTVNVDHTERMHVKLSDGTRITLDSGSELRYPDHFSEHRDVYLKGEAFFNVAPDPNKPFRVHATHAVVSVLGTKFNVRAWNENPTVAVAVREGKVSLRHKDPQHGGQVVLTRGKKSYLGQDGRPTPPVTVSSSDITSWMHNEMHFENTTVKEVLNQLTRWYDLKFVLEDTTTASEHLTCELKRSNVDDIFELITVLTKTEMVQKDSVIKLIPVKDMPGRKE